MDVSDRAQGWAREGCLWGILVGGLGVPWGGGRGEWLLFNRARAP